MGALIGVLAVFCVRRQANAMIEKCRLVGYVEEKRWLFSSLMFLVAFQAASIFSSTRQAALSLLDVLFRVIL